MSPGTKAILGIGAGAAIIVALAIGAGTYVAPAVLAPVGLTPEIVALARKWAAVRGIPAHWVLATIWAESRGNPRAYAGGREDSYGLMQVNWNAHGARIAATGYGKASLFEPDKNIEWGTRILKEAYDRAVKSGTTNPIDVATRMVYTGRQPSSTYAPTATAWQAALARTRAYA